MLDSRDVQIRSRIRFVRISEPQYSLRIGSNWKSTFVFGSDWTSITRAAVKTKGLRRFRLVIFPFCLFQIVCCLTVFAKNKISEFSWREIANWHLQRLESRI
jgi:hypothetical protein